MKKKNAAALMAAAMAASLLVGCGGGDTETKQYNLDDVMAAVEAVAPVSVPAEMDDDYLTGMYGINLD